MLLRYLIHQWLRQAAGRKAAQVVSDVVGPMAARKQGAPAMDNSDDSDSTIPDGLLAVLFALDIEAGGLIDRLTGQAVLRGQDLTEHVGLLDGRSIIAVTTGVGQKRAAQSTEDLIRLRRPAWVISAGFAGALTPRLRRGEILMANSLADDAGNSLAIDLKIDPEALEATPGVHVGQLLTIDRLVRQPEERAELAERYGADAVDMETYAVAEMCRRLAVRFLSVRIISDAADDKIPLEIECLLDQKTTVARWGAATGAIFRRPSVVKEMWQLKEDAIRASDRLAKFLCGVIPQLPER